VLIARCPIGARVDKITELIGNNFADDFCSPSAEIFL